MEKLFEALSRTKSEIIDGFPTGNLWVGMTPEELDAIKATLLKAQDDNRFIDLILNKPQLLGVFAFDGILTWEDFEDTFSDEDKDYLNTTKEEFEYMRNQLVKRGKIE